MLVKFQKSVVVSKSSKDIAYEKGVEIVKRFKESRSVTLEYLKPPLKTHPKEPAQPDLKMIQTMRDKWGYNIEPKGNPWEKIIFY
jgi:hypothetical protein